MGQSHSHTVTQSAVRNPLYMQTGASASMSNANPHPKSRSKVTQPAAVGDYRMNLSICTHTSPCAVISDMPPDHMRKSGEIWLNYLPNLNWPVFMRLNLSLVRLIWNRKVVEWVFPFSLLSTSHTLSRSLSLSLCCLYIAWRTLTLGRFSVLWRLQAAPFVYGKWGNFVWLNCFSICLLIVANDHLRGAVMRIIKARQA